MKPVCRGRDLLACLKMTGGDRRARLCILVNSPPICVLRPVVTAGSALDAGDIERLTAWRNRYRSAFLTEFTATYERTERWLRETVGPSDERILFMLDDLAGNTFGYMGLAQINWSKASGEADAVVRGMDAPRGTMQAALRTMLLWARSQLGLTSLGVRVRSDNPAVAFYRKSSFVESHRVPLRCQKLEQEIHWVEDASADTSGVSLVYMNWQPENGSLVENR